MPSRTSAFVFLLLAFAPPARAIVIAPREYLAAPANESKYGFSVSCTRNGDHLVALTISLPARFRETPLSLAHLVLKNSQGGTVLHSNIAVGEQRVVRILVAERELRRLTITASYWNSQVAKHDLVFQDLSRWLNNQGR